MLRWNKKSLCLFLFIAVFSLFSLYAQEEKEVIAFLKQGPFVRNSIDLLSPNTYKAYWAEYQTEHTVVEVFFSEANPKFEGVIEYCTGRKLIRISSYESIIYGIRLEKNLAFFFVFPKEYSDPCGFINVFLG